MTTVLDVVLPGREGYWPQLVRLLAETDVFLPNPTKAESSPAWKILAARR